MVRKRRNVLIDESKNYTKKGTSKFVGIKKKFGMNPS
jgi:hypothetical protein